MKRTLLTLICLSFLVLVHAAPVGAALYRGQVTGYAGDFAEVDVMLLSADTLETVHPNEAGRFAFRGVAPGDYAIKVSAPGYRTSPARLVTIPAGRRRHEFRLEPVAPNPFVFHWEEDQSVAGHEYAAHVNQPVEVEFLDETVAVADPSAAARLRHAYNVLLVDSAAGSWSQEHAYRLWETMRAIPQEVRRPDREQTLPASRWLVSEAEIENDINLVSHADGSRTVTIAAAAFVNAAPRVATVDGKRGIWHSRRLHHALVRYVTDNGRNRKAAEKILEKRFGVMIDTDVPDYELLTAETTAEGSSAFQRFHDEELVHLLTALEEMPSGMHKVPGLRYLVRRRDGVSHPLYPAAPAVAWTGAGYIEFMSTAFGQTSLQGIHHLIIHEKAHFLWDHLFADALQAAWITLGGWYEDAESPTGWYTTQTTQFVSAYAHGVNPEEDMAESIAAFILNPDKLKSRAPDKYVFIRDRIMQGDIYLSQIRADLTFEVYNLYPDYVFPGKIRRVDIRVHGGPNEDKDVEVEIELHALDAAAQGAKKAHTRIYSDLGTYFDMWLYPVDAKGNRIKEGLVLRGAYMLGKDVRAGYWVPGQIEITDSVGNARFERANDFGWKLYVDNPAEDYTAPTYVEGTAALTVGRATREGRAVQVIRATWQVDEDGDLAECLASIDIKKRNFDSLYARGHATGDECRAEFVMPDYMPSSVYALVEIWMEDEALNASIYRFNRKERAGLRVELVTPTPDTKAPRVEINHIEISATPTIPDAPNGETVVTIRYRVKDDISGHVKTEFGLRDPQGIIHGIRAYRKDHRLLFPPPGSLEQTWHSVTHILPPGSAPGTWGLAEMEVSDRARNVRRYKFTEVIHFEVD